MFDREKLFKNTKQSVGVQSKEGQTTNCTDEVYRRRTEEEGLTKLIIGIVTITKSNL